MSRRRKLLPGDKDWGEILQAWVLCSITMLVAGALPHGWLPDAWWAVGLYFVGVFALVVYALQALHLLFSGPYGGKILGWGYLTLLAGLFGWVFFG